MEQNTFRITAEMNCFITYEDGEVKSLSRVQLCDTVDCSPPGSSIHGILQARIGTYKSENNHITIDKTAFLPIIVPKLLHFCSGCRFSLEEEREEWNVSSKFWLPKCSVCFIWVDIWMELPKFCISMACRNGGEHKWFACGTRGPSILDRC